MTDTGQALRETSDALLRDLDVLSAIEDEKRSLRPGDPRLIELAMRIEEIAGRVLVDSVRERQLTEVARDQVDTRSSAAPEAAIDEIARPIQAILAEWREAERALTAAKPGSGEEAEARELVIRLRDEYRQAHEAARNS